MFKKRVFPLSCCRHHWLIEMELTGFFCTVAQTERSPAVLDTLNNCSPFPWVSLFPQLVLLWDWRNFRDPSKMPNSPLFGEFTVLTDKTLKAKVLVAQWCPTLCNPTDCSLPGSSVWDSPGKKTGMGCHALLSGILLTQAGIKSRLPALQAGSWPFEPHRLACGLAFSFSVTPGTGLVVLCLQQTAQQWTDVVIVVGGRGSATRS